MLRKVSIRVKLGFRRYRPIQPLMRSISFMGINLNWRCYHFPPDLSQHSRNIAQEQASAAQDDQEERKRSGVYRIRYFYRIDNHGGIVLRIKLPADTVPLPDEQQSLLIYGGRIDGIMIHRDRSAGPGVAEVFVIAVLERIQLDHVGLEIRNGLGIIEPLDPRKIPQIGQVVDIGDNGILDAVCGQVVADTDDHLE